MEQIKENMELSPKTTHHVLSVVIFTLYIIMPNMTSTVYMTKSDLEKCENDDEEDRGNSSQAQYDDNLHLYTLSCQDHNDDHNQDEWKMKVTCLGL